ncbi:N-acetylneuraminate synthase [Macrococcoides goetzii]|nr:N-acetylneuraminate synthase [Macrococcus goetzii]TDM46081.1 N-acetylneuraminate synthase [Macrococcus goetzii]
MVYIIAEIGVNHDGSVDKAKQLIDRAKDCEVDAVKFQSFKAENIVSKNFQKAEYQKIENKNETQFDMLKQLELTEQDLVELKKYAEVKNLDFLCSPFDIESISFLNNLGIKKFKVPSGEIINYPYLRALAKTKKQVILSTGLCTFSEIDNAVRILYEEGCNDLVILQCNTEYPTPFEDVNLNVIKSLKEMYNINIGFSDHTVGDEAAIAAVALGATVIEKHFTLNSCDEGPDHKASMEWTDFKELVRKIRNVELALGSSFKQPTKSEIKNKNIVRKKVVTSNPIKPGEKFTLNNITLKRSETGADATLIEHIIGKVAQKAYEIDEGVNIL